jgi:hypothetical protein
VPASWEVLTWSVIAVAALTGLVVEDYSTMDRFFTKPATVRLDEIRTQRIGVYPAAGDGAVTAVVAMSA